MALADLAFEPDDLEDVDLAEAVDFFGADFMRSEDRGFSLDEPEFTAMVFRLDSFFEVVEAFSEFEPDD